MVDEADAPRLAPVEALAGERQAPRLRHAGPRRDERRDLRRDDAEARLRHGEARIGHAEGDIADRGEAEPAAEGRPLDDGDDDLRQPVEAREERAETAVLEGARVLLAGPGRGGVELRPSSPAVAPGAEGAARAAPPPRANGVRAVQVSDDP